MSELIHEIQLPIADKKAKAYSISYTDMVRRGRKTDLAKLKPTSPALVGIVEEENLPKDGETFRMHYYRVAGVLNFGLVYVPNCKNVRYENGIWYFESPEEGTAYLMTEYEAN